MGKLGKCGEAELWCKKARRGSVGVRTVDGGGGSALECLSSRFKNESKGRQEETLASREC